MNWQQLKKVAAFYGRFTLSFTEIGHRVRRLGWGPVTPDFRGQRWLVTGGSGGLGGWIATEAAQAGATVVAAARSAAKLGAPAVAARARGPEPPGPAPSPAPAQASEKPPPRRGAGAGRPQGG